MALKEASKKVIYLYNLLKYFNFNLNLNINLNKPLIYINNNAAISLVENQVFYKKTKHIDIIYHYTRDLIKRGLINIKYIPLEDNLTDWFTKPVKRSLFINFK